MSITDQLAESLLAELEESARLKRLSNEELVMECIATVEDGSPIIDELCERLFPEWNAKVGH